MAATLQTLTGGRFVLGIGAGWRADEYAAYGYDFPKPSVRFAQLEELIQICRLMWTEDHPSFEGVHYSVTDASAPPLPEPVPRICIGAFGPKVGLPLVGRQADQWNCFFLGDDDWRMRLGIVRESAEKAGRDPLSIEVGTTIERPYRRPMPKARRSSSTSPIWELEITHFTMDFGHPLTPEHVLRFAEQVIDVMRAS